MLPYIRFILLGTVLLAACGDKYSEDFAVGRNEGQNARQSRQQMLENSLVTANKVIYVKERENILSYIDRQGKDYTEYQGIYISFDKGKITEDAVKKEGSATFEVYYKVLGAKNDGFSDKSVKTANLSGDTDISFGLLTALGAMQPGQSAEIIVPSQLNYVINSEGEKVKSDLTYIYKVKILSIRNNNGKK